MTRRRLAIAALIGLVLAAGALMWWKRGGGGGKPAAPVSTDPWDTGDSADRALAAQKRAARGDKPADTSPASLSGHVRRADDGAPIAGAVVSVSEQVFAGALFNNAAAEDIVVVTDAAGAWTATGVPPGRWVVTATAPELLPASVDVELAPRARKDGVDLALASGGITVSGIISDIGGGPIADARVTVRPKGLRVLDSSATLVAISGDDGRYRLTLPADSWHATAAHADYADEGRAFVLRDRPYTLDFTLTPGGTIRGVVVARDRGEPIAGARVKAGGGHGHGRDDDDLGGIGGVVTAADGSFTLRGLGSGALSLTASARGYSSTDPTVVEVGIGEEVSGVQVVLDRAYTISGFVVREGTKGDGVPGVLVGVFSIAKGWNVFSHQPSADDGYFEILGVRPATYMIAAMGSDVMLEIGKSITLEDRDLTDVIVAVDAGTSLSGVVVPPAVAQLGLSVDMKDVGLSNMFDVARAAMVRGASAADGKFTLRNAPRGTYKLVAGTADGRSGELEVKIGGDDQTGLVVPLEPRGAIAGRVVDPGGKAVAGVKVVARGSSGDMALSMDEGASAAVTAPDGNFRVAGLDPGEVEISVSDDQGELAWSPPTDAKGATFTIAGADTIDGVVLHVEARDGVIRGVVLGLDRTPVPDVWVTARSMDSPVSVENDDDAEKVPVEDEAPPAYGPGKTILTGPDGRFTITQLRRGKYSLVAEATKGGVRAQKVGVKTGDTVTLMLERLGTLSGVVTASGAPVPRYDLDCSGPGDQHRRHVASTDGRYAIDRLPPGKYKCNATADAGSGNAETRLVAVAGTLDIPLSPWASVTGIVADAQGTPRAGLVVIATGEGDDPGEAFVAIMGGGGPTTDAQGRFTVGRLGPGEGQLMIFDRAESFSPIFTRPLQLSAGQKLDLGTITVGGEGIDAGPL